MTTRISVLSFTVLMALMSTPLHAQDDQIRMLREQLLALSSRLDALEESNVELRKQNAELKDANLEAIAAANKASESSAEVANQLAGVQGSSWADRIRIKGDFRQRYENIDEESKDERNRSRIRARAAIIADVSDKAEVGLGFASGGDDPVSTNQTLGGGGSTKNINLDLAYIKWSGANGLTFYGGKFKNILYKPGNAQLLWDGDWNPEGIGLTWEKGDFFVNAMGTWLESDSKAESEFSYALQTGFNKTFESGLELTAGIGYHQIGTRGKGSFFGDDDDFFGNSFDPNTNTYLYDYEEFELFADMSFELGGRPANLFFNFVQNQDARDFDTGYNAGIKYGSAKAPGDWSVTYMYRDIEADAAYALVVDSDFAGGGTDGRGSIFKGSYAIARNINANFYYAVTERNGDLGTAVDYKRLQLDLALKY